MEYTMEERKGRHLSFWKMENRDRPLVIMSRQKPADSQEDKYLLSLKQADLTKYWSDPDVLMLRAKRNIASQECLGDSLPSMRVPLGPLMLSTFLGSGVEFQPDTVWFHPCTDKLDDLKDLKLDPDNRWWRLVEDCCLRMAQERTTIPVVPDLGGIGDNLAAMVGADVLMLEMIERPELVKKVIRRMLDIMKSCYDRIYRIIGSSGNGTSTWLGVWSPGKTGILQNDLSIMLSTEMYKEFFQEEFREMCDFYDYTIFHLDGTRSQQHLDGFLLGLQGLDGVQVGSDPGTRAMEVLPALKLIQSRGKRIFTYVFQDEADELFSALSPRGVCATTEIAADGEADEFISRLTRTARR
ncbi:MAG: hypothetical protein WAX69_17715 [Victivallales bacterium]